MIEVNPFSDVPVYLQIVEQVRLAVARQQLHPGQRLEPVRDLARRLGVNASTVARAYRELEHAGVIETNRRRGSVIARRPAREGWERAREDRLRVLMERSLVEALALGYSAEEIEGTFASQLAAWRTRHVQESTLTPSDTGEVRLARFAGSHDLALEVLLAQARRAEPRLDISTSYVGSLDGLLALVHGDAGLAGAHILDEETGEYNLPILRRLFVGQSLCVITLAERQQGLIVPHGNPQSLETFADLARGGVRFVNRQPGSGTRTLLDYHLRRLGVPAAAVAGYDMVAPTHLAVAEAVAEGRATAGLGLFAAARALGLGFVPLARERYDLVLFAADRHVSPLDLLLDMLDKAEFRSSVAELGGYDMTHTGEETIL